MWDRPAICSMRRFNDPLIPEDLVSSYVVSHLCRVVDESTNMSSREFVCPIQIRMVFRGGGLLLVEAAS